MDPSSDADQTLAEPGYCHSCGKTFKGALGLASHRGKKRCPPPPITQSVPESISTVPCTLEVDLCGTIARLRGDKSVLRRIPRSARYQVAVSFKKVLDQLPHSVNLQVWKKQFVFAYQVLQTPDVSNKKTPLTSLVKQNTVAFDEGLPSESKKRQFNRKHASSLKAVKKQVEAKVNDGDIRGAVRALAPDEVIAPFTQETFDALKAKHPPASDPPFPAESFG